jgi:hypothetical protein
MGGVPAGTDVEGRDRVPCRDVLYAIGADDVRALLEVAAHATSDDEVVDAAREERWDERSTRCLDKAWYGIGCCLNHLVEELDERVLAPDSGRCVLGDDRSPAVRTGSSRCGSRPRCWPVWRRWTG